MGDLSIGITGIFAAQKAMQTIGNNIANAATEGYHRQRVNLTPTSPQYEGEYLMGQGVDFNGAKRLIDNMLEGEILRQNSAAGDINRQLVTLQAVESAFGELGGGPFSATLGEFFNAMQTLEGEPQNTISQTDIVTRAEALANQFHSIGLFLGNIQNQIDLEAVDTVNQINQLSERIADLNFQIADLEVRDVEASNLRDQRDHAISEMSELVGLETTSRPYGVIDVTVNGIALVQSSNFGTLKTGLTPDGKLGVTLENLQNYSASFSGGKLGGLLTLKNEHIDSIAADFDNLAATLIREVNKYHVQGVPSYNKTTGEGGSFEQLDGWYMTEQSLADFNPPLSDGTIYIRVTNETDGSIERFAIDVDTAVDTMDTMAAKFDAVNGISASVVNSQFHIEGDTNYKFDFTPAPLQKSEPHIITDLTNNGLTDSKVSTYGVYKGGDNQNFEFTIVGTAVVGTDAFDVEIRDQGGALIDTVNVGAGYVGGADLTSPLIDGIKISFEDGKDVTNGDFFEVSAMSSPTILGSYKGDVNETYTATVLSDGMISQTPGLSVAVRDSSGDLVTTLEIGQGYATNEKLIIKEDIGLSIKFDVGSVTKDQVFEIEALANTDTSGFLGAVGINSFFRGSNASTIEVRQDIKDNNYLVATSMGQEMNDDDNISRLAKLQDANIDSLNGLSPSDYYRQVAVGIAREINMADMRKESIDGIMRNLMQQRDTVSGVDINNEAAQMMVFEQMFQAMAKYMSTINENMQEIMSIL